MRPNGAMWSYRSTPRRGRKRMTGRRASRYAIAVVTAAVVGLLTPATARADGAPSGLYCLPASHPVETYSVNFDFDAIDDFYTSPNGLVLSVNATKGVRHNDTMGLPIGAQFSVEL